MSIALITGVAGFIGSNFAHYLAQSHADYHIIGIDKLTPYSRRENIAALEATGQLSFIQCDIAARNSMDAIFAEYKPKYALNFAAESHNDRAIIDPTSFVHSNIVGAHTMLELCRQHHVQRYIHISTIEVYGEQGASIPFFTEASPLNAKTPYSASKAAADSLVRAYMHTYRDMDICLTHCANNYGPYQFPEKLIPLSVTNILQGKKAALYGDGLQKRDWLHVLDHCRGIDLVLHQSRKAIIAEDAAVDPSLLPIYDFSARHEVTNREILSLIVDELGVSFEDCVDFVTDRPNHDRRYLINPAKAERDLGFSPAISFEDGIRATVRWYVDNENWWKPIIKENAALQIDWSVYNKLSG